jgi:hypothetical protein
VLGEISAVIYPHSVTRSVRVCQRQTGKLLAPWLSDAVGVASPPRIVPYVKEFRSGIYPAAPRIAKDTAGPRYSKARVALPRLPNKASRALTTPHTSIDCLLGAFITLDSERSQVFTAYANADGGAAVWITNEKHDAIAFSTHQQPVLEIVQNKKVIYKRPPNAANLY